MSIKNSTKQVLTNIFTAQMRRIVEKHNLKIVAVAGSVGKTTTKLAITTVLSESLRVQSQEGNYNTPISLPFIFIGRAMPALYNPLAWAWAWLQGQKVMHSNYPYDVAVVELGVDAPGDMAAFKKLLKPFISVVTAVSEEHMEYFESVDAVAAEELTIAQFSDTLVVNADDIDDKYLEAFVPANKEIHSYGFGHAEYKISAEQAKSGYLVSVDIGSGNMIKTSVNTPAKHIIKSIAAAIAVADLMGLKPAEIETGIKKIKTFAGRMQLLKGIKDSIIIDDSYNSSPIAAEAALKTLYDFKATQHIAILGMMNELGKYSKAAHEQIGNICDPAKLDLLVTIGQDANNYLAAVAENKGCKVIRAGGPIQAGKAVIDKLKDGAVILAKGSQNGVFAEEAVKLLLKDRTDSAKLVRQNKFWLNKKRGLIKNT